MIWWVALFVAYVITAVAQVGAEFIAGAIIAAFALIPLYVASRETEADVRVPWQQLRQLSGVPLGMVRDAVMVLAAIISSIQRQEPLTGHFVRMPRPAQSAEEAIAIFAICATPNTLVTQIDDDASEFVVHRLTER